MNKKQTNETTLKDKTTQRLVSNGWALQSAHEVWEEIALAVQQERERIIKILEIGMNTKNNYNMKYSDLIKAINQTNNEQGTR